MVVRARSSYRRLDGQLAGLFSHGRAPPDAAVLAGSAAVIAAHEPPVPAPDRDLPQGVHRRVIVDGRCSTGDVRTRRVPLVQRMHDRFTRRIPGPHRPAVFFVNRRQPFFECFQSRLDRRLA